MYAIFEDGSRQYRVEEGDIVKIDWRAAEEGSKLELDRVLFVQSDAGIKVGQPTVSGAKVIVEVVDHPTTKTYIQKFRRRKNMRRFRGHRQPYTSVQVTAIQA